MKNVNSVKFVMQAIENEAKRHVEVYEAGGTIEQETRKFDPLTGKTGLLRKKNMRMITVIFRSRTCCRWC